MQYCLYKLNFTTSVHIGTDNGANGLVSSELTIHSDTLFSALYIESLKFGDSERLLKLFSDGSLVVSDLLPFKDEEFYIPKPFYKMELNQDEAKDEDRKTAKKLKYIPASQFECYLKSLKGLDSFDAKSVSSDIKSIATISVRTRVALKGLEQSRPYYVGVTTFDKNCGLYLVIGFDNDESFELIQKLLIALSHSGIGGKRTTGLGKFELDDVIYLDEPFTESLEALSKMLSAQSGIFMTLNTSLPDDNELDTAVDNGYFQLIRRGGYVQSFNYAEIFYKKKELYVFGAGSCFKEKYQGIIADVSQNGGHPVYRLLKPMFLGVNI
jgi:CRISPR-associated protein Csm4